MRMDWDGTIERFHCSQDPESLIGDYIIIDSDRKFKVKLPFMLMKKPCFNVAGWYEQRILDAFNYLNDRMYMDHDEEDFIGTLFRPLPAPEESSTVSNQFYWRYGTS